MWLSILFFVVALFVLVAGLALGGVFLIVLVPLAVILGAAVILHRISRRASSANTGNSVVGAPLPHSTHQHTAPTPTGPDALVDARQQQ